MPEKYVPYVPVVEPAPEAPTPTTVVKDVILPVQFLHMELEATDLITLDKAKKLAKRLKAAIPTDIAPHLGTYPDLVIDLATTEEAYKVFRTTVAYVFHEEKLFLGFSFCSPDDQFNKHLGREKAYARLTTSPTTVTGIGPRKGGAVRDLVQDILYNSAKHGLKNIKGLPSRIRVERSLDFLT